MTTAATIKSAYPLPVYNYRVRIGDANTAFSEVSGLNLQYEPITYRHGLSWKEGTEHMPGMKQPLRITLKKGLTQRGNALSEWIGSIRQNKVEKRDLTVELCDEAGTPVVTWQVLRAIPLKLNAPGFNAASNNVAIEELELMAGDLQVTFH